MKLIAAAVAVALPLVMGCSAASPTDDYRARTEASRAYRQESLDREAQNQAAMAKAEPVLQEWTETAIERALRLDDGQTDPRVIAEEAARAGSYAGQVRRILSKAPAYKDAANVGKRIEIWEAGIIQVATTEIRRARVIAAAHAE